MCVRSRKRHFSMNGRGKLTGVSVDVHIQEGKCVVVFQFIRKFDVGVSSRKILSKFNDVFARSDQNENIAHISSEEDRGKRQRTLL